MTHTHLSFNVCKLGEHERPVEGQLRHIVVIQPRTEGLEKRKEKAHTHTLNVKLNRASPNRIGCTLIVHVNSMSANYFI